MILSLDILLPGTVEARLKGCNCPTSVADCDHPLYLCDGHLFSPRCPLHCHAVMAEVQRAHGRPQ